MRAATIVKNTLATILILSMQIIAFTIDLNQEQQPVVVMMAALGMAIYFLPADLLGMTADNEDSNEE